MSDHNSRPCRRPSHTATWLATILCGLLVVSGCRDEGDGGYHEVTAADIAPTAGDDQATSNAATGDDPEIKVLPDPVSTKLVQADSIEPPAVDTPDGTSTTGSPATVRPTTGTDPVNPLRPALPDGGLGRPLNGPDRRPGPLSPADTKTAEPAKPRKIKLLVKERSFRVVGPDKALRISYDDFDLLKVLNMEPVPPDAPQHMPAWLRQLDGKRIRVRGFMYPTFQDPVEAFVLARDNQICCFGRNPKIYDLVRVALRKNVTSPYIQNRPFDVVGLFHIAKKIEDGRLLYSIDDAIVVDR